MNRYLKIFSFLIFGGALMGFALPVLAIDNLSFEALERMDGLSRIEGTSERDLNYSYEGETRSLINWDEMEPDQWLDLERWKEERAVKDQWPHWRVTLREQRLTESMGRVLDCRGECYIYREAGRNRARFRSGVVEGDEVRTVGDSYAWVFLYDGTMVRLAPESSVTFQEMNIGVERVFLHARINQGQVAWISRTNHLHEMIEMRETDPLFLPLSLWEANYESLGDEELKEPEDGNFLTQIETKPVPHQVQTERLNEMIAKNNKTLEDKEVQVFLVMPNGTIVGNNPLVEMIVLPTSHAYIKQKRLSGHSLVADSELNYASDLSFYYRGFENLDHFNLIDDLWYRVSSNGRLITTETEPQKLAFAEILTRRIPSIFLAREMWLEKYGESVYNLNTPELLAQKGRRLWENIRYGEEEKTDLELRIDFLKEYTRRLETSNLTLQSNFYQQVQEQGGTPPSGTYDDRYYRRAYEYYILDRRSTEKFDRMRDPSQRTLHSTRRNYWRRHQVLQHQQ